MAGHGIASSSSSHGNTNSHVYEVFLNHQKKRLASHIYRRLIVRRLNVFLDQPELEKGEGILPQIKEAIRTASVHVAIFSPTYAQSHWCLDELALMVESKSTIIPVFHDVDPSELRWTRSGDGVHSIIRSICPCLLGEKGRYARDLEMLEKKTTLDPHTNKKKPRHASTALKRWRDALYVVSNKSGFVMDANGVPNAKPDRESTEIDIFGMEGIPPDILAAHDEEHDDEKPSKTAKVEVPPSGFGGIGMGSSAIHMPPQPAYSAMPPLYPPPSVPLRPSPWHVPSPSSQPWSSAQPTIHRQPPMMPMRPPQLPQPPQPLFPIQNIQPSSSNSVTPSSQSPMVPRPHQPPPQPLFPIQNRQPSPSISTPSSQSSMQPLYSPSAPLMPYTTPSSQALFPINGPYSNTSVASSLPTLSQYALPQRPTSDLRSLGETSSVTSLPSNLTNKPLSAPVFPGGSASTATPSHMYALGPNTGGPSIGPPPVISNKPPAAQGLTKEVYLVWDDEAMSMEERRTSLAKYQVHDVTSQMSSVDAAIDRRILESRLAGRMGFGI